jgi:hypothetical protein
MFKSLVACSILSLLVVACVAEDAGTLRNGPGGAAGVDGTDPTAPGGTGGAAPGEAAPGTTPGAAAPGLCEGKPHIGFANVDFVADRKPGELGTNRRRVKPYSALRGEFQRAIGVVPPTLAVNAAAFGEAPARWYVEPVQGAVSLYTTYTLAFTSCFDSMTQAEFQVAPTVASATDQCTKLARKYWQRTPTTEEVTACAALAATDLATEAVPRRRWAHACASLLSSTGFTTY